MPASAQRSAPSKGMTMPTAALKDQDRGRDPSVGYRPLYQQVRDLLVRRLADGQWQPGKSIPSEHQLAQELGVSQGTVRKALDTMAAERLLVRRQGRGTFVAELTEQHILFHFFKLRADDDAQRFPASRVIDVTVARADGGDATDWRSARATRSCGFAAFARSPARR